MKTRTGAARRCRGPIRLVTAAGAALALSFGMVVAPSSPVSVSEASAQSLAGDVPAANDAFYQPPTPEELSRLGNGDVVKERPVYVWLYRAYQTTQIAFKSTDSKGRPIMATTLVVRPWDAKPDAPLLSYQHYINGLSQNCSPGQTLMHPTVETVQDHLLVILRLATMKGWAVALPDHLGPHGAYTAGHLGAHITLDGIRAVHRVGRLGLTRSPSGLLGYSGGGLTTAWTAIEAPEYAPELDIVGSAQGGVPADMTTMAHYLGAAPHPAFGLAFAAAIGLEREYPELVNITPRLSPEGKALLTKSEGACVAGLLVSGFMKSLPGVANGATSIDDEPGLLGAMRINSPMYSDKAPKMPVFMWHSKMDPLVPFWDAETLARLYCAQGTPIEWSPGDAPEHLLGAVEQTPRVLQWLEDRFAGRPAPVRC